MRSQLIPDTYVRHKGGQICQSCALHGSAQIFEGLQVHAAHRLEVHQHFDEPLEVLRLQVGRQGAPSESEIGLLCNMDKS